jgi:hypothetical protein
MTGFRNKQYLPPSLHKIMHEFYHLTQGKHLSNQEYYNKFNSMVNTAAESGATIGVHPSGVTAILAALAVDIDFLTQAERVASVETATQRYLAVAFILGADKMRYSTLVKEIDNEFLRNKGSCTSAGTYPTTTVAEVYDYLCNYKRDPKNLTRLLGHNAGGDSLNTGVAFVQDIGKADDTSNAHEQSFTTNGGSGGANHRKKVY